MGHVEECLNCTRNFAMLATDRKRTFEKLPPIEMFNHWHSWGKTVFGGVVSFQSFQKSWWMALVFGILMGSFTGRFLRKEDPLNLAGYSVLITGVSKGFAEVVAYQFASSKANIIITDNVNEEQLKRIASKCSELGGNITVDHFLTDFSNLDEVNLLLNFVRKKFDDRLDYLSLNHQIHKDGSIWKGTAENVEVMKQIYEVNVFSYVRLTSLFMPLLERNSGHIVISSTDRDHRSTSLPLDSSRSAIESFFIDWRQQMAKQSSNVSLTIANINTETEPDTDKFRYYSGAEVLLRGAYKRIPNVNYPGWTISKKIDNLLNLSFVKLLVEKLFFY